MVTVHDPQTFYTAVVTRLLTTGKNVGEGVAPDDKTTPYCVLYSQSEDDIDSSLGDPTELGLFRWQVTSIGADMDEAHWMQWKVRTVMLGWIPSVSGLNLGMVLRDGGQPVLRDDKMLPSLFYAVDIFTCFAD